MNKPPLIKAGQGRTPHEYEELVDCGAFLLFLAFLFGVTLIIAGLFILFLRLFS